ncbi:hypothetical protein [Caulobacter flavus]|jgi:hypothetical protein|uniref:PD-(D/E)XK nuclease domain-containing protein n=1 Tax=Caulobacter flavus TaxID=1679497 RepID=UPI00196ABA7C|nr:hypothetical protein [Caulobacter flavus]
MTLEDAIAKLKAQRDEVDRLLDDARFSTTFKFWQRHTRVVLAQIFQPDSSHHAEFAAISYRNSFAFSDEGDGPSAERYRDGLLSAKALLASIIRELEEFGLPHAPAMQTDALVDAEAQLAHICRSFAAFAKRLQKRRGDRAALMVEDEHDVQYLMHAILGLYFEDIRPEEPTPTVAGGSAKIDFLLKAEGIAFELKMTRPDLKDNKTGGEALIDIGRYPKHPDVRSLVYFVHDPEGYITNPKGLIADIERDYGALRAKVIIVGPFS